MDSTCDGIDWTAKRVETRLIAAFRAMPHCPVYTVGSNVRTLVGGANAVTSALSWAAILEHDREGKTHLWAWARCRATRTSFSELVEGNGWKRSTVEASRRRAATTIAAHLRSTTSIPLDSEKTSKGSKVREAAEVEPAGA